MTTRACLAWLLTVAGVAWIAVCAFATADTLAYGYRLDPLAVAGLFSVGLLSVTWGWLIGGRG